MAVFGWQKKKPWQLYQEEHRKKPRPKGKLADRKCIGSNPFRGECGRMFKPRNSVTFMCDTCNDYIKRNRLQDE